MLNGLCLPLLLGVFALAAGAIWYAGIKLSDMTDVLSTRLGLGGLASKKWSAPSVKEEASDGRTQEAVHT